MKKVCCGYLMILCKVIRDTLSSITYYDLNCLFLTFTRHFFDS